VVESFKLYLRTHIALSERYEYVDALDRENRAKRPVRETGIQRRKVVLARLALKEIK
jgi:hypothetical protein